MNSTAKFFLVFILILSFSPAKAEIKIHELYGSQMGNVGLMKSTATRSVSVLDQGWIAYPQGSPEDWTRIGIPSSFEGTEDLVYSRELPVSRDQINNSRIRIHFLGLSYSAEISLDGLIIYKHPGGEMPFFIDLPQDVLKKHGHNSISVRINHRLDSEATIPFNQRFLFPMSLGGIFRDAYIETMPLTSLSDMSLRSSLNESLSRADMSGTIRFTGGSQSSAYRLSISVADSSKELPALEEGLYFNAKGEASVDYSFALNDPRLWDPNSRAAYDIKVRLYRDGGLIDEYSRNLALYSLRAADDMLYLNGRPFVIKGTTYYPDYGHDGILASYDRLRKDFITIKSLGFNTVRFAKSLPHPYALKLCQDLGLLAFVEMPANSIPENLSADEDFKKRAEDYLVSTLDSYSGYSIAAVGLGSSYLSNSARHKAFIEGLAKTVKGRYMLTYASFVGIPQQKIEGLDFYGYELFCKGADSYEAEYKSACQTIGKGHIFISEATYPCYMGSTNGYLNPFSNEAQAKYYNDLIDYVLANGISGFFVNTVFSYRGNNASISAGYSPEHLYKIGICDAERGTNSLSCKVISSKLNAGDRVTIPIGQKAQDTPLLFILAGLSLALLMGLLIQSQRKFREDASRALLRPYNFFADVRDQRILSGLYSNTLMLILAGSFSLLLTSLLYYFKTSILFEKLLISFGHHSILGIAGQLAWNPGIAFIYLWILSVGLIFFISLLIKGFSIFIKTKVLFSSVYYTVTWAVLPLVLLLPLDIILYRLLNAELINSYILAFILVFLLWLLQRIIKGIYVIFDLTRGIVRFYVLCVIIGLIGATLIYLQLSESAIYHAINSIKQFKLM